MASLTGHTLTCALVRPIGACQTIDRRACLLWTVLALGALSIRDGASCVGLLPWRCSRRTTGADEASQARSSYCSQAWLSAVEAGCTCCALALCRQAGAGREGTGGTGYWELALCWAVEAFRAWSLRRQAS